ncbi:MAG: NAD(P)H-dependent glycerol-3-phosphate dehydrogenase [Capsulimonadales bacterium]|nr:NAD(P)H-dependent glycerol-3-phosphate dehydrogenase [Capsulimonadales bacterium]
MDGRTTVLGGGSWGTALALLLAQNHRSVALWDRNESQVHALREHRENRRYLPGFPLPESVAPTGDLNEALAGAEMLVVAVPSAGVRDVLTRCLPLPDSARFLVLAAKGLEADSCLLPAEVAEDVLGTDRVAPDIVALSGPNLALEVARGIPTAAVAACPERTAAEHVADRFNGPTYRVYTGNDRIGVEIGGAVKNVLAIAAGVSDGLGFGENTKAALLTRGLAEMTRFGVALGADAETFFGLAGVGDLMATAASRLSRNWRVGEGIARGEPLDDLLQRLGQVAEGVPTARALRSLAERKGVEMPVCRTVAALLFDGLAPREAVASLMTRSRKGEW